MEIETRKRVEVVDITSPIEKFVENSGVKNGICLAYTLHTTTGIVINEAEPGLVQDMTKLMASLVPQGTGYLHDKMDSNAHAHLQAMLLGTSAVMPVDGGKLVLGTWQRVLFVDLDGPRRRTVYFRTISE
jgi:secondary thiamine-phosphate synthase enzyme